jgi:NADH:ubiquinone oxidoreductase subunit D
MVWTFEEREKLIVLIEGLTGTRFHSALLSLGRLRYSVSLFFIEFFVY